MYNSVKFAFLLCSALVFGATIHTVDMPSLSPISSLTFSAFMGRWFEMYSSPMMNGNMDATKMFCVVGDITQSNSATHTGGVGMPPVSGSQPESFDIKIFER